MQVRGIVNMVTRFQQSKTESALASVTLIEDHDCYHKAVRAFHKLCYNLGKHSYAMSRVFVFANLCNMKYDIRDIKIAIRDQCIEFPFINVL